MLKEKRLKKDIINLDNHNCKYDYKIINEVDTFTFYINGPKDSYYETQEFKLHLEIPKDYPFKSPSVGFISKIYHPNVDYTSGSICLDVLNQKWAPIYDLVNIYNIFIPQLLMYPNADDPLNSNAAFYYMNNKEKFKDFVKEKYKY